MARYSLIVVVSLLVIYGLVKAWPLLLGPSLVIESPQEGASFPGGLVPVSGTALRTDLLHMDGGTLLRDAGGSFSVTLTFPRGGSILTFIATDRFGRRITITRTIFVP